MLMYIFCFLVLNHAQILLKSWIPFGIRYLNILSAFEIQVIVNFVNLFEYDTQAELCGRDLKDDLPIRFIRLLECQFVLQLVL